MENYKIITVPDPVLKAQATPVNRVDDAIRRQFDAMLATMYAAPGIGLAANQVGLLNRVFVMDVKQREGSEERAPVCMANPEILWKDEEPSTMEEGCLSIPGQFAEIVRPLRVRVRYLDYNNQAQEMEVEALAAHCVQHEIDHLDGVLFIDYLSSLKRGMILRKVGKLLREHEAL